MKDYRPITLMSKTLEKVVNRKMDEVLAAFPLSVSQHAYQRGKSAETALHGVVMATLIDIVGAFSNSPHVAIDNGARDHGINGTIRLWLGEYLKHRYVVSEHGFLKISGKVSRG